MRARKDESKGNQALLASELLTRVCSRACWELDLLRKAMTQCTNVLLKDLTNFAKLQHEKFQLEFESKVSELKKLASWSTAKTSGCESLLLSLAAKSNSEEVDSKSLTPPKMISPK